MTGVPASRRHADDSASGFRTIAAMRGKSPMSEVTESRAAGSPVTPEERAAKLLRDYRAEVVGPWFADIIAAAIRAAEADAAAREREACLAAAERVAVELGKVGRFQEVHGIAKAVAAIRARGAAP